MKGNKDVLWPDFNTPRTDLAVEARDIATRRLGVQEIPGVISETASTKHTTISRVKVINEQGERALGKVQGNYVTIESPDLTSQSRDVQQEIAQVFAQEFNGLVHLAGNATVMCCGLGNWQATPDALGPRVVEKIMITRHLYGMTPKELRGGMRPVCAIAPGVLGITGMETGEVIQGIVNMIRPDLVVVIDALAARSTNRVGTTIQMGDTGISPGSGVGNRRIGITRQTLGVPVVAIGVPTVVDAITIASDAMDLLSEMQGAKPAGAVPYPGPGGPAYGVPSEQKQYLMRQLLQPYMGDLIVTPKEIDDIIEEVSRVVAAGLNAALHPNMDWDRVLEYLS
ncbi:MAG TPA: GPR endopeptidase [Firmicutes bacterium]|nr:GPR endopeptidase [Bacillota bacterium]